MQACDRTGHFRAEIIGYGIKKAESGAVAVTLHCKLTENWDEQAEAWVPWVEFDMEVYGDVWVVKKDGSLSDKQAQKLINFCGWNGSFASIADSTWKPTPCQIEVGREDYQGQTYYKIAWVNGFDSTPGQGNLGNVDAGGIKDLEARFGSPLRALAGNAKRNAGATNGNKPPAPPKPSVKAKEPAGAVAGDDGIPF